MRLQTILGSALTISLLVACSGSEDGVDATGDGDSSTVGDGDAMETGDGDGTLPGDGDGAPGGDGDDTLGSGGDTSSGGTGADSGGTSTGGDTGDGDGDGTGGVVEVPGLTSGTFLMDDDGYVLFEAEDVAGGSPPGNWVVLNDAGPCDTGNCAPNQGAYLQYQADSVSDCGNHSSPDAGSNIDIPFEVKTKGFHRVIWRNLRDHRAGGCENDKNNDSFMTFPGALNDEHFLEPFKVYGGGDGTFSWSGKYDIHGLPHGDVCVELEAGEQTMKLAGRSDWHAIDRIAIIHTGDSLDSCTGGGPIGGLDGRENTGQAQ